MKALIALPAALMLIAGSLQAQSYHYVNGSVDHNGNYRNGHYQTDANGTRDDNWSTRGNYNPFTGRQGTRPGDSYP
jgi:hypothetical protein